MKKSLLLFTLLLSNSFSVFAQTALSAGDIMFIGVNSDGSTKNGSPSAEDFLFLVLEDLDAGTEIYFTDFGYTGSSAPFFQGNQNSGCGASQGGASDGIIKWTSPAGGTSKGTQVLIRVEDDFSTNHGILTAIVNTAGGVKQMDLSTAGEVIHAVQGTLNGSNQFTSVTFIAGLRYAGSYSTPTQCQFTSTISGDPGTGFEVEFPTHQDNGVYSGATLTGSKADLQSAILDVANNWTTGSNSVSDLYTMPIASSFTVSGANTLPTPNVNSGSSLSEGGTDAIPSTELEYDDAEQADTDLTYTVTTLPSNGVLRKSASNIALNGTFSQTDINNNLIDYIHDGGESTSDSFGFTISDGQGGDVTNQTFTFTITAVNDAPAIATNTGISVKPGGTEIINLIELNENDPDDSGTGLTYTVTTLPANGSLRKSGTPLTLNGTFTQQDLDFSLIDYVHDGSATVSDSFVFSLADGGENGASPLTSQTVNITVSAAATEPTVLAAGDIMFIGFNSDDSDKNGSETGDDVLLLLLEPVTAGTELFLTDFGYTGNSAPFFQSNENAGGCGSGTGATGDGMLKWTAPSGGLAAGSQVLIRVKEAFSTSHGVLAEIVAPLVSNGRGMSMTTAGETVHAFQGTVNSSKEVTSATFISSLRYNNVYESVTRCEFTSTKSGDPGTTFEIEFSTHEDNGVYQGILTGDKATLQTAILDVATNWSAGSTAPGDLKTLPIAGSFSVSTSIPSSATVAATVFLEGAYNGTNLNTSLNSDIPLTQPYSNNGHSGGSAGSIPANAVDWVLVELREAGSAAAALNATKVGSTAGFLMNDGTIKATDGTSDITVSLSGNSGADFFVVIYHRNHLPIMSASAISESSSKYMIDFTSNSANTHQTTSALVTLSGGKFGMPSGDADGDGDVDGTDLTTWRSQNGISFVYGTSNADFNLDGEINAIDRNLFWKANNTSSKTSQVPTT